MRKYIERYRIAKEKNRPLGCIPPLVFVQHYPSAAASPADELLENFQRRLILDFLPQLVFWLSAPPGVIVLIALVIYITGLLFSGHIPFTIGDLWFSILAVVLFVSSLILRRRTKAAVEKARRNLLGLISKGLEQ